MALIDTNETKLRNFLADEGFGSSIQPSSTHHSNHIVPLSDNSVHYYDPYQTHPTNQELYPQYSQSIGLNTNWNSINGSYANPHNFDSFEIKPHSFPAPPSHSTLQSIDSVYDIYKAVAPSRNQRNAVNWVNNNYSSSDIVPPSLSFTHGSYKKVKGKSSQRCRKFPEILPEDKLRMSYQQGGKNQLWYFVLRLLKDFTKKSIIVWTGNQRHFRIKNIELFCHLWSKHNEKSSIVQWESFLRTMRTCGTNGILMAVPSTKHNGRNEEGVFGFVIEPSFYLNMNREELNRTIRLHSEMGPLTVGSPIDSSFGYPSGTELQVIPIMDLDREGNLIHPIPYTFITVLPQSNTLFQSLAPSTN